MHQSRTVHRAPPPNRIVPTNRLWTGEQCAAICAVFVFLFGSPAEARTVQVVPEGIASEKPQDATVPPSQPASPAYPDDVRLDTALRMLGKGALDGARQTAQTVLKAKPDCDRAAAIEGIVLNKMKRYEEAKPLLERARDSKQPFPEQKHAAHFLGWCHYHLGELSAAQKAFELHLTVVPNEPDSTFGLGLVALGEDRLDDADRYLAKALEGFSKPRDSAVDRARVLTRMADVSLRRDDPAAAEALLRRAIEASPVQHETWSKLARVCDRLGKVQEADAARANADRILTALGRKSTSDAVSTPTPTPNGSTNTDGEPKSAPSDAPEPQAPVPPKAR
jgi:Flp pilus assembly protein TadD